ncbi:MAG: glycosyltransferase [Jannaschia sp.]
MRPAGRLTPVIQVIHKFDRRAGPDLLVGEMLRRLDRNRWRPSIFMLDFGLFAGPSLLEEMLPPDVPLTTVPWCGGRGLPGAIRAFRAMLRRSGAQLVHSHDIPSHLVSLPTRARQGPVRIASVHGIVDQTPRQRQWNAVNRRLLRRLDHTIVSSDFVRDALSGLDPGRTTLLLNAIETDAITPRSAAPLARIHTAADPLRIVCVARLSEEKGHRYLIEAIRRLGNAPVRLDVIGTGPLLDDLRRQAADLPRVHIHGFVADATPYFRTADIFALASIRESLSVGVLEAMAYGVPVLTTDVGAHPAVVGESGAGWILPRGDPDALAHAIRSVLDAPKRLPAMAARGVAAVRAHHSMDVYVDRITGLYEAELNRRR